MWLYNPRVSPDGERVAVFESSAAKSCLIAIDRKGRKQVFATGLRAGHPILAWSPDGREIWLSYFKGTNATVGDIGRQLGVATILEGSVRRAGNRVRITTQLINVKDGFHLWSETYDRELNDIFAIQESIAGEVVGALKIKLMGPDGGAAPAARKPTTNLDAYDAYLLGQQRMAKRASASIAEAAQSFQKAIDLDPNYALAYVGLADATGLLAGYGNFSFGETKAKVEPLLQKAIQLDGRLGEAYASLGNLSFAKGDFAAAESAFQKGRRAEPQLCHGV